MPSGSRIRNILELALFLMAEGDSAGSGGTGPVSRETLAKLVDRHHRHLLAMIAYKTGNEETALDLLQETYLAFLRVIEEGRDLGRFDDEQRVRNYLITIAVNKVKDHYKVSGREAANRIHFRNQDDMESCLDAIASREGTPEDVLAAESERERLASCTRVAMEALPERYRGILVLKFTDGLENPEIARSMRIGIKAVESLLFRAKRGFRKEFEKLTLEGE